MNNRMDETLKQAMLDATKKWQDCTYAGSQKLEDLRRCRSAARKGNEKATAMISTIEAEWSELNVEEDKLRGLWVTADRAYADSLK